MADQPPYRKLPWAEVDLLLHPGRFLQRHEAMTEIDRIRELVDERTLPQDAALLSRTATALERKAADIVRWMRPIQAGMTSVAGGLFSSALAGMFRTRPDAGAVTASVVCFALAIVLALSSYVWPTLWTDVAEEYRKLAADLRKVSDKLAAPASPASLAGVRVDPEAAGTEDEAARAPEGRTRKAGDP